MVIGLLTVELQIPASGSLKDKRQVIRSLVTRLRQEYNISVAQVDHLDSWQLCALAIACVSNEGSQAQHVLQRVAGYIEARAVDYVVLDIQTELL
ncbi:MAG: DUF503 domain-containing protein [Anaerolineae bacterium]